MSNDESNRDNGYFAAMRRCHPVKLGDTIDGKRVVMTAFRHQPGLGNLPIYRLAGENEARTIGSVAMRTDKIDTLDMISAAPESSFGDADIMIRRKIIESLGIPLSMTGTHANYSSACLDSYRLQTWGSTLPIPKTNDSES